MRQVMLSDLERVLLLSSFTLFLVFIFIFIFISHRDLQRTQILCAFFSHSWRFRAFVTLDFYVKLVSSIVKACILEFYYAAKVDVNQYPVIIHCFADTFFATKICCATSNSSLLIAFVHLVVAFSLFFFSCFFFIVVVFNGGDMHNKHQRTI